MNTDVNTSSPKNINTAKNCRLSEGDIIDGRYRILGFLGAGGFAKVYRAYHENMQREVAIKVMEPSDDETFIERFKREATLAGNIQHPSIVTIHDCGEIKETGQLYIAMELIKGRDLAEELAINGPLTPHRMFKLIRPVLDALGVGHAQGIVHKDLKPANLFLMDPGSEHEHLKVLDFGVAHKQSDKRLTTAGQMLGTVLYLAPEYINSSNNVSPAIDVYQMALIMSELLTGTPAVDGETYTVLMKHCMGEIQMAEFLKNGPAAEVFRKATCVRPEGRYQNCTEFGAALDEIADYFCNDETANSEIPQNEGNSSKSLSSDDKKETSKSVTKKNSKSITKKQNSEDKSAENDGDAENSVETSAKKASLHPIVQFIAGIGVAAVAIVVIALVFGVSGGTGIQGGTTSVNRISGWDQIVLSEFEKKLLEELYIEDTPELMQLRQQSSLGNDRGIALLGLYYRNNPEFSEDLMFETLRGIRDIDLLDEDIRSQVYYLLARYRLERAWMNVADIDVALYFKRALELGNIDALYYVWDHKLDSTFHLEQEYLHLIDKILADEIGRDQGYALYMLGLIYAEKARIENSRSLYDEAIQLEKRSMELGSSLGKAEYYGLDLCNNQKTDSVYKQLEKMMESESEECASDDCRSANAVMAKYYAYYTMDLLSSACPLDSKTPEKLKKRIEKSVNKDFREFALSEYLRMSGAVLSQNDLRMYFQVVSRQCSEKNEIADVVDLYQKLIYNDTKDDLRSACDEISNIFSELSSEKCIAKDENLRSSVYADIAGCYKRAMLRGQIQPMPNVDSSTKLMMQNIGVCGPKDCNIKEYMPALIYGAYHGDGMAMGILRDLYKGQGIGQFTTDDAGISSDLERACYWGRHMQKSAICSICSGGKEKISFCEECKANEDFVLSCQ